MDSLAAVCESIQRHASRNRKVKILADYFQTLGDEDLSLAVQFLSTGPVARASPNRTLFDTEEKVELKIGGSVLREALRVASGWDKETLSICYAQVGDTGETIGLLLRGIAVGEPMSLGQADALYQSLFQAPNTARRVALLVEIFRKYQPLTLKYFVKVITRGLRIGLLSRQVKDALELAGRQAELTAIEARLFQPTDFMLAKPLDQVADLPEPSSWLVEDKYDGIRAQLHFDHGTVKIYSRGMEEVTQSFPDIAALGAKLPGSGIVDGELLAWRDGRALNFNILQRRLARKAVHQSLIEEIPVVFMAYDLLLRDGRLLLNEPLSIRRAVLAELPLTQSLQYRAESQSHLEQLFVEARSRGNEGLLLKRPDSLYEPGKRSGAWLKLKRPYGTLDVVITAAEQGNGRRATVFSDYTFGVRSANDFVNIGKAYSGLTDAEIKDLTRQLRSNSTEKFGRMMLVKPEIVLEVAFDGVQRSSRHKGGYALRFPRILRWRKDKRPEDCDSIEQVEKLYLASVADA